MRKRVLFLGIVIGAVYFTAFSESNIANATVSIIHSPELAVTDANGAFTVPVALSGQVTDNNPVLPSPIAGVAVTLPYFSEKLTGITNSNGEYLTQKINISGVVVSSDNKPIPNAWVSIRPQAIVDTADELGILRTGGSIGTGIRAPFLSNYKNRAGAILRGNRLLIASSDNLPVFVSLFTVKGQQLFSIMIANLSAGARTVRLPELPGGFYLLKASGGGFTAIFRQVLFSTRDLVVQQHKAAGRQPFLSAKTNAALFADTLVAFADGYHAGYAAVTPATATDVKITLKASNQWKPAGPQELERQGSMVKIKAKGHDFSMGQPVMITEDIFLINWADEVPAHPVAFSYDFWMDTTEVTQKQYIDVMTATNTNFGTPEWKSTYGLGDNVPSYSMSLGDAIMYCNARSKLDSLDTVYSYTSVSGNPGQHCGLNGLRCNYFKNGYRLPTEAEWEYACRGGTVTDFYWKKNYRPYPATAVDTNEISGYAHWSVTSNIDSNDPEYAVKKGVATKKPNNYGLYDMAGGLAEYTLPGQLYYTYEAVEDPKPSITDVEIFPIFRGGNWGNRAVNLRSSCRKWAFEGNYDYWFRGFRTVKEVR